MAGELLIIAVVWGMIAFAVAIDANRRGLHSGFWAVLTLFTGLFGAIAYGLVALIGDNQPTDNTSDNKREPTVIRVCPECDSDCGETQQHCATCGEALSAENEVPLGRRLKTGSRRYCSNCNSEVDREASECRQCGAVFR